MARTSAKAKKSRQEVLKSKAEEALKEQAVKDSEETNESTDKENDDESNYEVEKIIHTRTYRGKKQYLVRWKGYSEDGDTWENESMLNSCNEILEAFNKENAEKEKVKANSTENSEDENEVEENAKAKKKGKQKSAKKVKTEEDEQSVDVEENGVEKKVEAKKRSQKEKATLPPKKAKREVEEADEEEGEKKETDYEVEKILEVHTRKDGKREFLIRWKGYRPSEDTWEPEAHLDCAELIEKFMDRVEKAKSIPARELRESRNPVDRFTPSSKVHGRANLRRNMGFRGQYQE